MHEVPPSPVLSSAVLVREDQVCGPPPFSKIMSVSSLMTRVLIVVSITVLIVILRGTSSFHLAKGDLKRKPDFTQGGEKKVISSIEVGEQPNFERLERQTFSTAESEGRNTYLRPIDASVILDSPDLTKIDTTSYFFVNTSFDDIYEQWSPTSGAKLNPSTEVVAKGNYSLKVNFTDTPGGFHTRLNAFPNEEYRIRAKVFVPAGLTWHSYPTIKIFNSSWSLLASAPIKRKSDSWVDYELNYAFTGNDIKQLIIGVHGMGDPTFSRGPRSKEYFFYVDMFQIEKVTQLKPDPIPLVPKSIKIFCTYSNLFTAPNVIEKIQAIAAQYDLIRTGSIWSKEEYNSYLKYLNPNITLVDYHNSQAVWYSTPEYRYIDENHPEWFLRDSVGNKVYEAGYFPPNYINDIGNHDFVEWITDRIVKRTANKPIDALFIDVLSSYYYDGYYSRSLINPRTNKVFTNDEWRNASIDYVKTLRLKTDKKLIGNLIGSYNGWQYYVGSNNHTKDFLPILDGIMIEGFMGSLSLSSEANWKMDIDALREIDQTGTKVLVNTIPPAGLALDGVNKFHIFSLASFLLGKGKNSYFYFCDYDIHNPVTNLSKPSVPFQWALPLGDPIGDCGKQDNVYMRDYQNGLVIVNPTGNTYAIDLPESYNRTDGAVVNSVYLSEFEGIILIKTYEGAFNYKE